MKKPESKFNFGDKVIGKITKATGVVISIIFSLNGSVVYVIQPEILVNGSPVNPFQVNEFYLEKFPQIKREIDCGVN